MNGAMYREWYRLGEVSPESYFSMRRVMRVAVLAGLAIVGLMVVTLTQSPVAILGELVIVVGLVVGLQRRDALGRAWIATGVGQAVRDWWSRRAHWDEHSEGTPAFGYEDVEVVGWSLDDDPDIGEIGFVVSQTQGDIVMILEVEGDGEGIRSGSEHVTLERCLPAVLRKTAEPSTPVTQVQCITRVSPAANGGYRHWQESQMLRAGLQPGSQVWASMEELVGHSALLAHEVRSWVGITMPIQDLLDEAESYGLSMKDPESLYKAAAGVGSLLARTLSDEGVPVVKALTSVEIAALTRSLWLPAADPDDISDVTGFWRMWPAYRPSDSGNAVVATDPRTGVEWWHSSGSIPRDGWAVEPVLGRWLEPLILQSPTPHRVVVTTFETISGRKSRQIAKSQLTTARAAVIGGRRKGKVSLDEEHQVESAAEQIVRDITTKGQSGVVVTVRVGIAAQNPRALKRGREEIEHTYQSLMAGRWWRWDDGRQVPAKISMLPLGRRIPT